MTCPVCKKATDKAYRPFCSKRCADVDLGKWLDGVYSVPSQDPEEQIEAFEEIAKQNSTLH
ncbi:DNA gyrase inhibitor YacG [Shimia thalassica]|uniref:DNA gyrase inhibitor YacG n=1 Tax=Shimia thalassica TaxID=1715693 RepID=UPI000C06FFF9|nr:DNA gyrase inhibitor YacG [Shimia thalassica]PHO04865.1 DNA gyrase inhibitor YacG [Rhodobacteraceae bacterium 4F10]MBU2941347.1 DNA gyrase inhibitor YacG [Shimia thalassica]MDO6481544.1 DNA gyrase inhibitor YacG [Shimia thalassica]MDO6484027.1 DNA gyrase inhibitor YacG [Shimia thalassica]MDO6503168.1 DNA gyrase inhibitor YacG [Shimia thalassica]